MNRVDVMRKLAGVKQVQEPEYVDVRVRVLKADGDTLAQVAAESGATSQAILCGMISAWARRARTVLKKVEPPAAASGEDQGQ